MKRKLTIQQMGGRAVLAKYGNAHFRRMAQARKRKYGTYRPHGDTSRSGRKQGA